MTVADGGRRARRRAAVPAAAVARLGRRSVRHAVRLALAPALAVGVAGCAVPWDPDHPERLDRVALTAGDAQQRNIRLHAVDPVPPEHPLPPATYDGLRTLAVLDLFYDRVGSAPEAGGEGTIGAEAGSGS